VVLDVAVVALQLSDRIIMEPIGGVAARDDRAQVLEEQAVSPRCCQHTSLGRNNKRSNSCIPLHDDDDYGDIKNDDDPSIVKVPLVLFFH
jgi:hypothetical protein